MRHDNADAVSMKWSC